jgi:hypothetical protein
LFLQQQRQQQLAFTCLALEHAQALETYVLGNPDMFNMNVSDSLAYMADAIHFEVLNGKKLFGIAS